MLPSIAVPSFDGEEEPFPGFAMEVELRCKVTNRDVGKRTSALVCRWAMGSDRLVEPDALDAGCFEYCVIISRRTPWTPSTKMWRGFRASKGDRPQSMDEYLVKFDLLRRKADTRVQPGGSSPAAFASVISLRNTSLPWADKSLVLAGVRGILGMVGVSQQIRR